MIISISKNQYSAWTSFTDDAFLNKIFTQSNCYWCKLSPITSNERRVLKIHWKIVMSFCVIKWRTKSKHFFPKDNFILFLIIYVDMQNIIIIIYIKHLFYNRNILWHLYNYKTYCLSWGQMGKIVYKFFSESDINFYRDNFFFCALV